MKYYCAISIGISLILMELIGNVILKDMIMRERPCWIDPTVELLIKAPSSYSFPSGHTFAGFASAVTVFLNHKFHCASLGTKAVKEGKYIVGSSSVKKIPLLLFLCLKRELTIGK